jgi:hypothetical protein
METRSERTALMTLENWQYRNPMDVLDQKQQAALRKQQACTGCINRRRYEAFGEIVIACAVKRTTRMIKCEMFTKEAE